MSDFDLEAYTAAALTVGCDLPGCAAKAGQPCRNSITGEQRTYPHSHRVVKGRRS